jgi:hypothetical protein
MSSEFTTDRNDFKNAGAFGPILLRRRDKQRNGFFFKNLTSRGAFATSFLARLKLLLRNDDHRRDLEVTSWLGQGP